MYTWIFYNHVNNVTYDRFKIQRNVTAQPEDGLVRAETRSNYIKVFKNQ